MNNKEFITALARKSGYKVEDTQNMVRSVVYNITARLTAGEQINFAGLGTFEVKKRMERIITNPGTGQKMLVPPKVVVNFKPVSSLKEKIK